MHGPDAVIVQNKVDAKDLQAGRSSFLRSLTHNAPAADCQQQTSSKTSLTQVNKARAKRTERCITSR